MTIDLDSSKSISEPSNTVRLLINDRLAGDAVHALFPTSACEHGIRCGIAYFVM